MIKLLRVDHRLLHGQVAFSWTKQLGADCILIANDEVVQDELRMTAIRMSKPNGVKLVMKSVDASIKALTSGVTDLYQSGRAEKRAWKKTDFKGYFCR